MSIKSIISAIANHPHYALLDRLAPASLVREQYLMMLITGLISTLPYVPMVTYSGFVMDDAVAVQRNPNVVSDTVPLSELFSRDFWGLPLFAGTWTHKSFRPVTTWTYRIGFLLHGIPSSGFHVATLVMHVVCSFMVGVVAYELLRVKFKFALLACALFGSHPIHTENVLYLVGRADVLATIFFLAALVVADRAPEMTSRNLAVVASLTVLAGLSKETGFTTPLLASGIDVLRRGRIGSSKFWFLVILGVLLMVWRHRYTDGTEVNMSVQDNPFSYETERIHRWLSFGFVHAKYLQLMVFPLELCYDYSLNAIPIIRSFADVRTLMMWSAYLSVVGCVWWAVRMYMQVGSRAQGTQALIGISLTLIPWLPASNILFPVGTVVGERLLYTPSVGFVFLIAVVAESVCDRLAVAEDQGRAVLRETKGSAAKMQWKSMNGRVKLIVWIGAIIVVTGYMVRTGIRVTDWADADTLFTRDGHRQTASSKTQFNLGITHMSNKQYDRAVAALIRCIAADPMSALPYWRIGQIEILRGNFTSAEEWLLEASTKFSATVMIRDEEIFHDIAVASFQNKKVDRAFWYLGLALEINKIFPKGLNNYGCLLASREPGRSVEFLTRAVMLKPDHALYVNNLAFMSQYTGNATGLAVANNARAQLGLLETPYKHDCIWEFVPAT